MRRLLAVLTAPPGNTVAIDNKTTGAVPRLSQGKGQQLWRLSHPCDHKMDLASDDENLADSILARLGITNDDDSASSSSASSSTSSSGDDSTAADGVGDLEEKPMLPAESVLVQEPEPVTSADLQGTVPIEARRVMEAEPLVAAAVSPTEPLVTTEAKIPRPAVVADIQGTKLGMAVGVREEAPVLAVDGTKAKPVPKEAPPLPAAGVQPTPPVEAAEVEQPGSVAAACTEEAEPGVGADVEETANKKLWEEFQRRRKADRERRGQVRQTNDVQRLLAEVQRERTEGSAGSPPRATDAGSDARAGLKLKNSESEVQKLLHDVREERKSSRIDSPTPATASSPWKRSVDSPGERRSPSPHRSPSPTPVSTRMVSSPPAKDARTDSSSVPSALLRLRRTESAPNVSGAKARGGCSGRAGGNRRCTSTTRSCGRRSGLLAPRHSLLFLAASRDRSATTR